MGAHAAPPADTAPAEGARRTGMSADVKALQLATGGGGSKRCNPLQPDLGLSRCPTAEILL